jgi:hypothetical protein
LFWTKKALLLSALPLALISAPTAQADTIVVRSNGPSAKSFPPGKSLPGTAKFALQSGDTLTLLDATGTRVLKGPGNFALAALTSTASGSSLGQFLRNTGARQGRTGASRGGSVKPKSPNIWYVDFSKAGPVCVIDPNAVTLWRPLVDKDQTLTFTRTSDGKATNVLFAKNQTSRAWPVADLPVTDGVQYRVSGEDLAAPVSLTLRTVGTVAPSPETIGSALIKAGCTAQVDLLVEKATPPATGG